MGVPRGDVHSVLDTITKIQGDIEMGYLSLGAGLGNGKEESDVRDTVDQEQKVLDWCKTEA